jgi:two-component system response regulator AlgR
VIEAAPRIKVLVVDDEPPARARLARMLSEIPAAELTGEASSGREALAAVTSSPPDGVLLDIRMPGMDGLEVARHLGRLAAPPVVVFTTAYDAHALEAFEARALDYLLKPVRRERLAAALERAAGFAAAQRAPARASRLEDQVEALRESGEGVRARTHLSARVGANLVLVAVAEVRYLRADSKYVEVGYPGGHMVLDEPLARLAEEHPERFLRVHRNALVATAHVSVLRRAGHRHVIELEGVGEEIEVSRRHLPGVRARLAGRG